MSTLLCNKYKSVKGRKFSNCSSLNLDYIFNNLKNVSCSDPIACPELERLNRNFTFSLLLIGSKVSPGASQARVYYSLSLNAVSRETFNSSLDEIKNWSLLNAGGVELYYETLMFIINQQTPLNIYDDKKKEIFIIGNEQGDVLNPLNQNQISNSIDRQQYSFYVFNEFANYYYYNQIVGCESQGLDQCPNYFYNWNLDDVLSRKIVEIMNSVCK